MQNRTILWIGLLGFLAYNLFKQASRITMGNPVISHLGLSANGIMIKIKMPVLNRSDFTAQIEGFLGVFKYKGNVLGPITLVKPTELPSRSTAEPEFSITIGYGSILTEVWDFLQDKLNLFGSGNTSPGSPATGQPAIEWSSFRVVGTLWVSGLAIDIDEPIIA